MSTIGTRLNLQNCGGNSLHLQLREVAVLVKVLMLLKVGMQELVSWASRQLESLLCWINWLGHFQRYRKYLISHALSSSIILQADLEFVYMFYFWSEYYPMVPKELQPFKFQQEKASPTLQPSPAIFNFYFYFFWILIHFKS